MSDELAAIDQTAARSTPDATPRKKPKPRRTAKPSTSLPDLTQLGNILKCLHQIEGNNVADALKSVDSNGIAIFADGNALRYVAIPYETYNMLVVDAGKPA